MKQIDKNSLEHLRKTYLSGARVRLEYMDDIQAPPIGSLGTIIGVDDIGSIMVKWDNGSSLSVVYGCDKCTLLDGDSIG